MKWNGTPTPNRTEPNGKQNTELFELQHTHTHANNQHTYTATETIIAIRTITNRADVASSTLAIDRRQSALTKFY